LPPVPAHRSGTALEFCGRVASDVPSRSPGAADGVRHGDVTDSRSRGALGAYLLGAYGLGFHEIFTLVLILRCADLDLSLEQVGLVVGIGSLTPALLAVPIGTVIDRVGARRSFVVTSLATAALSLAFAVSNTVLLLLLLQLVMGCTRTTAWVASQGYVTGIGDEADRSRHAGRFGFFVGAGQALSTVAAGLTTEWGGTATGFLLGGCYSLLFALVASRLPDLEIEARSDRPAGGFRQAGRLLGNPGVQTALLLSFTRLWVVTAYSSFVPLLLITGGLTPAVVGLVMAVKSVVATLVAPATGALARRSVSAFRSSSPRSRSAPQRRAADWRSPCGRAPTRSPAPSPRRWSAAS
jgi:MFS family permease